MSSTSIILKQRVPEHTPDLMGLSQVGLSVFPGCTTTLEIPIVNNKFNIGLDGPDNQQLKEKFEKYFGVEFDSPEGREWLNNYEVTVEHDVTAYDPNNLKDLFDLHILKVNKGMGIVATSDLDIEETANDTYKFILQDERRELERRVQKKEQLTVATLELAKLHEGNTKRLILIAKYLFNIAAGIGDNKSMAFEKLFDFINQSTENCKIFLNTLRIEPAHMELVVKVREGIHRNIIRSSNGQYILYATQTPLGRNEEEIIAFLSDPKNEDLLGLGLPDDSPTSLTSLLNQN